MKYKLSYTENKIKELHDFEPITSRFRKGKKENNANMNIKHSLQTYKPAHRQIEIQIE